MIPVEVTVPAAEASQDFTVRQTSDSAVTLTFDNKEITAAELENEFFNSVISGFTALDINADGIVDYKDLEAFDTNVDLDGDGTISRNETVILNKLKNSLKKFTAQDLIRKTYHNINSIEDVIKIVEIDYLSPDKVDAHIGQYMSEHLFDSRNYSATLNGTYFGPNYYSVMFSTLTGLNHPRDFNRESPGWRAGVEYLTGGDSDKNLQTTWFSEQDIFKAYKIGFEIDLEKVKPQNTYLRYIQSADLTKIELEEILCKIKSASPKAQTELSEVVKVIEQKLAGM